MLSPGTTASRGPPPTGTWMRSSRCWPTRLPICTRRWSEPQNEGFSHVILDGTIIPADRCREQTLSIHGEAIDLWYSGKAHSHGGNIPAVLAPDGFPLWVSAAEPGSVHDLTAARPHALPALYQPAPAGLPALADPAYAGAGIGIHTPVSHPPPGPDLDIGPPPPHPPLPPLPPLPQPPFPLP